MTTIQIGALHDEVRALAAERGAVIIAHNYQRPEVQDVADYVGDSLGLSRQAAAADAEGVHMLSTGGMLRFAREHRGGTAIVATETGMLHPLRQAAPDTQFVAANEAAHCRFMKTITPAKLLRTVREGVFEVRVDADVAARARRAIERMIAIG